MGRLLVVACNYWIGEGLNGSLDVRPWNKHSEDVLLFPRDGIADATQTLKNSRPECARPVECGADLAGA
jgi:hypothetical protein